MRLFSVLVAGAVALPLLLPPAAGAQRRRPSAQPAADAPLVASDMLGQLTFRHIGPEGNRVVAVAGIPGDPNIIYAGAASGGIFKTTDAGLHWDPIFDGQPVLSIGALAIAPSDQNVVWAGTGEPNIRSNISVGWGIFRSTDAGRTWKKLGLDNTGRIARIAIHPTNPDIVLVAALGTGYGPHPDRGVYRTADGGTTWTRVLFVDEKTGGNDVEFDPHNPRIVYATTWQFEVHTWGRTSGGPGSGIWKSTDGGATWTRLRGNGLPTKPFGKADLSVAPTNPDRIYALIETSDGVPLPGVETETGELWRSDNGGASWNLVSHDRQLGGRTHYYTRVVVAPDNENEAYFLAANWSKTLDAGRHIIDPPYSQYPGGDHHDLWMDPRNTDRMVVAHDVGVSITSNRGRTWNRIQLPIAQMYHVTVDNRIPYFVYGNRQDGQSARGPSNSRVIGYFGDAGIPRAAWHSVGGGESGWATPDPVDSNLVWSSASGNGSVGGIVTRYDLRTRISSPVEIWPEVTTGHGADSVKYRFQWSFPLTISPHDHNRVYVGSQHVHATGDGGRSWQVISPDLTRNDRTRQGISGGLTPDNIGVEYAGVVFAIAESPVAKGQLWAGTNDGLVQLSVDNGASWTNVTPKAAGLPEWATISNIAPSRWDANTAYLTVDAHQVDNHDPWVFRTTDLGKTWTLLVAGIAKSPLSYAHWVKEDPVRRGLLYLGTENALHVSFNGGALWQPLQNNLPHAPVVDVTVQEHFNDLVLATYGRGFWILDDVTPLQQLSAEVVAKDAHLFAPRPVYRFRMAEGPWAPFEDQVAGTNPRYGASLSYWLKSVPATPPVLTILDARDSVVRTLEATALPGVNRVYWDLQSDWSKPVLVRTSPLHAPEVTVGVTGRSAPGVYPTSIMLPPGRYTVKLTVGTTVQVQPIEVRRDPNSQATDAGIVAKTTLQRELTTQLDSAVAMINAIEVARAQLLTVKATITDTAVLARAGVVEQRLVDVEEALIQLRITGRGQDMIRYQAKLAEKFFYLINDLNGSDDPPTEPQRTVGSLLTARTRAARTALDAVMREHVAPFNQLLRDKGLAGISTTTPRAN
ncbi:MAG: hypothetical protein IT355_11290 [Gemmatimonadaceae bacterium]|nr:hypothetical protein [Gemmatimonadaceae bacterium]